MPMYTVAGGVKRKLTVDLAVKMTVNPMSAFAIFASSCRMPVKCRARRRKTMTAKKGLNVVLV